MEPKFAKLKTRNDERFPIKIIHYGTRDVTLQESKKVFNTVGFNSVEFDFSCMTEKEKEEFKRKINSLSER